MPPPKNKAKVKTRTLPGIDHVRPEPAKRAKGNISQASLIDRLNAELQLVDALQAQAAPSRRQLRLHLGRLRVIAAALLLTLGALKVRGTEFVLRTGKVAVGTPHFSVAPPMFHFKVPAPAPAKAQDILSLGDKNRVAAVMVMEAGGEGIEGLKGVLNVMANRAGRNPQELLSVISQHAQFSSLNRFRLPNGRLNWAAALQRGQYDLKAWSQSLRLIDEFLCGRLQDNTGGAHYFMDPGMYPSYLSDLHYIKTIKHHRFYRD